MIGCSVTHRHRRSVRVCGEQVRQFRLAARLTQLELAAKAGYSERLIRKAEAGGTLSLTTVADIAEALSSEDQPVRADQLCFSPVAIAKAFIDAYDTHGRQMLPSCRRLLAANFVFDCSVHHESPLYGCWLGEVGFQSWLDALFAIMTRPQAGALQPAFMMDGELVTASFKEHVAALDGSQHYMWFNFHFVISEGLIVRIDIQLDTFLLASIEDQAQRHWGPPTSDGELAPRATGNYHASRLNVVQAAC